MMMMKEKTETENKCELKTSESIHIICVRRICVNETSALHQIESIESTKLDFLSTHVAVTEYQTSYYTPEHILS